MKKIQEILRLRFATELSFRQISRTVNVPSSTVSDYCKRFEICTQTLDELLYMEEESIYALLFPEKKLLGTKKDRPLPDVSAIHKEISKKGVTFELLWMEYKEQHPDGYALSQFKDYYYRFKNKIDPTMRQTYIPGHQMFIDYSGLTVPYCDSQTGEVFKSQIFVSVLGHSGYVFVHATPSQKQEYFVKSHILAYEFYGGVAKVMVPDNLKSAVISHTKKGIIVNESYAELCRHYGCAVEPARPRKPQDKGIVEQAVQGIQRWILAVFRNRTFFSVDEINQAIAPLIDTYNHRVLRQIGNSRHKLFEQEERQHLQALPVNRHSYKEIKVATVDLSYHVQLLKCFYSVPYAYLKEKVEVKYSTTLVEIYLRTKLVATHPRLHKPNERSTLKEHMPKNHQYQHEKMNPKRLLNWADSMGSNTKAFVEKRLDDADYPVNVYKSIIAVLHKAKIYGDMELNLALGYASSINATRVKSIESILSKKLYLQAVNNPINTVHNDHENLRVSDYYQKKQKGKTDMNQTTVINKINDLSYHGFKEAYLRQVEDTNYHQLSFEERVYTLLEAQEVFLHNKRIATNLRASKIKDKQAAVEDIEYGNQRKIDKQSLQSLITMDFIRKYQNIIITGKTGTGKSYLAQALANRAILDGFKVFYMRIPTLLEEIKLARADGTYTNLLRRYSKFQLLILDDFGVSQMSSDDASNLFEIIEDRTEVNSLIITSQLPVSQWYDYLNNGTVADAILDRVVHSSHRIELEGESMRKLRSKIKHI